MKKRRSLQDATRDTIYLDDDSDDERPIMLLFTRGKFPKLDPVHDAVKKTQPHVINVLKEAWGKGGLSCEVYEPRFMFGKATVGNCVDILMYKRLGSYVIDTYAEHLLTELSKKYSVVNSAMVYPCCVWGELKKAGGSAVLRLWGDDRMEEALGKEVLLFPVNPCLNNRSSEESGDHWVLLMYDVKQDHWYFYNSVPPRTQGGTDHYYKQCAKLIMYVETQMRMVMGRTNPSHPMLGRNPRIILTTL